MFGYGTLKVKIGTRIKPLRCLMYYLQGKASQSVNLHYLLHVS